MADQVRRYRVELSADSTQFSRGFEQAGASVDKLNKSLKPVGAGIKGVGDSFGASAGKLGTFADSLGKVSTTLARSASAFGLPAEALRTIDDAADVAELGLKGLTTTVAGFNAATLGIVGAGAAIGIALGGFANRFEVIRKFADDATRGLYDFLAANKLFGESTRDQGAGQEAGLAQFRLAMAAKNQEALEKQVASLKAQGKSVKEIAEFYKGTLNPALLEHLGLSEKQVKVASDQEKAAKAAAEQFKNLVDSLSGKKAQEEVDQLARALKVVGTQGVGDLEALREKLVQLEKQGAKINDKGLLGVLRGGNVKIPDALGNLDLGGGDTANLVETVSKTGLAAQQSFDAMALAFVRAKAPAQDIKDALENAGASADQIKIAFDHLPKLSLGEAFKGSLKGAFKDLPNVILGAIQGGGDIGKSVGAHLGGSIASGIGEQLTAKLSDVLGKGLGSALGSIIPGLGSLIGSQLGGLISKGLGKLGSALGIGGNKQIQEVNKLRDAFLQAQGGFVELQKKLVGLSNQDLVKKIFDAKTVDEFNAAMNEVTGILGNQEAATQALKEATDRYGFSIEELGPAMQRQELEAQAGQLLQDFKLLTASGIDVGTVIKKMGPNLNEFVNQSIAAGQAIPEALRPVIDQLFSAGQLLHEDGTAFTQAEKDGLSFSQTMSEQFTTLIQKIDAFVSAITGIAPEPISIPVRFDVQNQPPSGIPIPPGAEDNTPGFQHGTGFKMVDFGAETLARLHGPEMILNKQQVGKLEGLGGSSTQATTNINITEDPYQSSEGRIRLRERTLEAVERKKSRFLVPRIQTGLA